MSEKVLDFSSFLTSHSRQGWLDMLHSIKLSPCQVHFFDLVLLDLDLKRVVNRIDYDYNVGYFYKSPKTFAYDQ